MDYFTWVAEQNRIKHPGLSQMGVHDEEIEDDEFEELVMSLEAGDFTLDEFLDSFPGVPDLSKNNGGT